MDSINSFKGYGKVDERDDQAFKKKTRKRMIILGISAVVLVAVIVGVVVGVVHNNKSGNKSGADQVPTTPTAALKSVCQMTEYPDSCISSISAYETSNQTTDPEVLFKLSMKVALDAVTRLSLLPSEYIKKTNDPQVKAALTVCQNVLNDAVEYLNDSISAVDVNPGEKILSVAKANDLKTWLSTTMTNQDTCLDALSEIKNSALSDEFSGLVKNSTEYSSNSLAIVAKLFSILTDLNIPIHRKLLAKSDSGFPGWVGGAERRLLQGENPKPDVTVAQDGSGDVKTIKEAVAKVPKKSKTRFVIYVKAGKYVENVILDKSKWNVMIYGDGKSSTIISGSLNRIDGTMTFDTATFATVGKGFIARDIRFENTAGPDKHQAVALRSGADFSVFYRCSFDGFQDTLYAHSNRQFYRDCDITGTIDFIFGNAAVVFQNCSIQPRQPQPSQFVTITAQGKKDPNMNTGISIQQCTVSPLDKLTAAVYLGRPWKDFSTTVIMRTNIGAFLDPAGWIEWIPNVVPPKTIFYAEYQNTGPGSAVDKRVKWDGYRPSLTAAEASKYTLEPFIQGSEWLPPTNVDFQSTL